MTDTRVSEYSNEYLQYLARAKNLLGIDGDLCIQNALIAIVLLMERDITYG